MLIESDKIVQLRFLDFQFVLFRCGEYEVSTIVQMRAVQVDDSASNIDPGEEYSLVGPVIGVLPRFSSIYIEPLLTLPGGHVGTLVQMTEAAAYVIVGFPRSAAQRMLFAVCVQKTFQQIARKHFAKRHYAVGTIESGHDFHRHGQFLPNLRRPFRALRLTSNVIEIPTRNGSNHLLQDEKTTPSERTKLADYVASNPDGFKPNQPLRQVFEQVVNKLGLAPELKSFSYDGTWEAFKVSYGALHTADEYQRHLTAEAKPHSKWTPRPVYFQETVAMVRKWPALARKLGLIFDLEFDGKGLASQGRIRLVTDGRDHSTWTLYEVSGQTFRTRSRNSTQPTDLLPLGDESRYLFVQDDAEGLLLAANATLGSGASQYDLGSPRGTAVRRSTGLHLVDRQRKPISHKRKAVHADNELAAEDLVAGYRFDIQSSYRAETKKWYSLSERIVDGKNLDSTLENLADEGVHQLTANLHDEKNDKGEVTRHVLVNSNIVSWTGWSLCAPRPDAEEKTGEGNAPLQVKTSVKPKSLPRLRFGQQYRIRARIVDITGNSLSLADADEQMASDAYMSNPVRYLRNEPVFPPLVTMFQERSWWTTSARRPSGESDRHVVIRSHGGPEPVAIPKDVHSTRYLHTPQVALEIAESHGRVPEVAVDSRSAEINDPAVSGIRIVASGDIKTTMLLPLPSSHGEDWTRNTHYELRVVDAKENSIDVENGVIVVHLVPAARAKLSISSTIRKDELDKFRVFTDVLNAAHDMRTKACDAECWALTPATEVTVLHAVRKPLEAPKVSARVRPVIVLPEPKKPDERVVPLDDVTVSFDPKSTGRIEIHATSRVRVGDAKFVERSSIVATQSVPDGATKTPMDVQNGDAKAGTLSVPLGDTRRQTILLRARAVSRFGEYFAPGPTRPVGPGEI